MNTLKDRLQDLAVKSAEQYELAFSKFKDPDDAQSFLDDLLAEAVEETLWDIKNDLERYTE